MVCGSRLSAIVWDILDEVLLILGGGVDGRTLSGLGLLTAGHGEPGTGKHAAESGHGELMRGWREHGQLSCFTSTRTKHEEKGIASAPRRFRGGVNLRRGSRPSCRRSGSRQPFCRVGIEVQREVQLAAMWTESSGLDQTTRSARIPPFLIWLDSSHDSERWMIR